MAANNVSRLVLGKDYLGNLASRQYPAATAQNLAADSYSGPFDVRSMSAVRFQIKSAVTGNPAGKWNIQGTDDIDAYLKDIARGVYGSADTAQWTTLLLPANCVSGLSGTISAFTGPSADITCDGSGAVNIIIQLRDVFPAIVRAKWVSTGGGGASVNARVLVSVREV